MRTWVGQLMQIGTQHAKLQLPPNKDKEKLVRHGEMKPSTLADLTAERQFAA